MAGRSSMPDVRRRAPASRRTIVCTVVALVAIVSGGAYSSAVASPIHPASTTIAEPPAKALLASRAIAGEVDEGRQHRRQAVAIPDAPLRYECASGGDALPAADALMANRYTIASFPAVTLPADPDWDEDPFHDVRWLSNYHNWRWMRALNGAWIQTGDQRYLDRALWLAADWYRDNPRSDPPSAFSWNGHATAWRAMMLACFGGIVPIDGWLLSALLLHGRTLADPAFYEGHGNHALNQAMGLLEVGCVLGRADWRDLAADRIADLFAESVDAEGVTNEQAVGYQAYNYNRYKEAAKRLAECGASLPAGMARLELMPGFLAYATLPNGEYEMLGDTYGVRAMSVPGTILEYSASQGRSGPRPDQTAVTYRAGFAFFRTGWGEARPYDDEVAYTARYGPGWHFHGHADGTSLTLYGYGTRLLLDSGMYTFNHNAFRRYFKGRSAHNVVSVAGLKFDPKRRTALTVRRISTTMVDLGFRNLGYAGVDNRRRVVMSKALGYALVEDRLTSTTRHRYKQLWHLPPGSRPSVRGTTVRTNRERGNVLIRQLIDRGRVSITTGARDPIQGWVSFSYNKKRAAPVASVSRSGTNVRYLTLIVPGAANASASVDDLHLYANGFAVTIRVRGHTERVVVRGTTSSITPLD